MHNSVNWNENINESYYLNCSHNFAMASKGKNNNAHRKETKTIFKDIRNQRY